VFCRHAQQHEAAPGLWQAQADTAVAVCLQALEGAGLLPACWEGNGYERAAVAGDDSSGEEQAVAGDAVTGCYQVPPGCRQVVALMPQETKDRVSEGMAHSYTA
jgi:hypothetical protein